MVEIALVAAAIAAAALTVVCIKCYLFMVRTQAAVDRLRSEAASAVQAWAEAARGVRRAAGKLEESLAPLSACLCRIDRVTEKLEPDLLAVSVIQPAISRVSSWLGGVRKGLAEMRGQRPRSRPGGESVETEVG
jgi:hypothetical protein